MARLKSTHFPELDLSLAIKSGLGGPLLRAGLIVDNFELSTIDHEVLSTEGRHPVHRATLGDGAIVALKEFIIDGKGRTMMVLQREAGLLHRLRHPNIVELLAVLVDTKGTRAYLQMPLYSGGTLMRPTVASCSALPNDVSRWPVGVARALMHQLLTAVAHLHVNDVIHSDIHPSNVMLDNRDDPSVWRLVLGDFDVSLDLQSRTTLLAVTAGATLIGGRDEYLPPEVKPPRSQRATKATDMFAVGVLFKWLAKTVTRLDTPALIVLCAALTNDAPEKRPPALQAHLHPFFNAEVEAMQAQLEKEQAAFAASVAAMADDQRRHAEAARALANRKAALEAVRADVERERSAVDKLKMSHTRDNTALQQRADAVSAEERKLRAQAKDVERAAREAEKLRQKVEADKSLLARQYSPVPGYWVHKDLTAIYYARMRTNFVMQRMEALLRSTPLGGHGGGCGGGPSLSNATVTRVERVENTLLWRNYGHRKAIMQQLLHRSRPTAVPVPQHEVIDADINEVFLFHGTSPALANVIAQHGFDERVANLVGL
jgi:serine/threonine protein kinase